MPLSKIAQVCSSAALAMKSRNPSSGREAEGRPEDGAVARELLYFVEVGLTEHVSRYTAESRCVVNWSSTTAEVTAILRGGSKGSARMSMLERVDTSTRCAS